MGFGVWDYMAMAAYIGGIVAMGLFFMTRQKSTEDYFLGGRQFHWLPVAISMFASLFSAISYIAIPAEAYNNGMMLFLKSAFVLLGVPPAVIIFVRFFRRLSLTTAYEYLERRFDLRVRLLASGLFLLLRSFYLGVVLFASAVALQPATGWSLWFSIILMGVVATLYTTMGGIKSVIWTDVVQFVVLLGGISLVLGILAVEHPEGLAGIWAYAKARGHTFNQVSQPDFYTFDPFLRLSLWMMIISAIFTKLSLAGADQISIQRYLSTRNEKDATRSLVWGTVLGVPVMFLLFLTGLGLFWFYGTYPGKALPGMAGDHALAHFISNELPPGIGGVIMAAILAAVMSTVDSGLNSLSTCTITDFYSRLINPGAPEDRKLRMAKITTLGWGVMAILSAALMIWIYGAERGRNPLVIVSEVTLGFFGGILLGVFLLGVLTRRANSMGVLIGAATGLVAAVAVTTPYYFRELPPDAPRLSFLWINIIGCVATVVVGYLASLPGPVPQREKTANLTYWDSRNA
jgi:SSS family transporter